MFFSFYHQPGDLVPIDLCLSQDWEPTLDGALSKPKPRKTHRLTLYLRTQVAQTLCSEVSVSGELKDGSRGGLPIQDWPRIRNFPFIGLVQWNYRIKLSSVVNNSLEWILFSSVSSQIFLPHMQFYTYMPCLSALQLFCSRACVVFYCLCSHLWGDSLQQGWAVAPKSYIAVSIYNHNVMLLLKIQ